MPAEKENGLSQRGWSNVEAIMPKIAAAVEERQIKNNTNIDLSTAENWLIRSELIEICKDAINQKLAGQDLSYPRGFSGDPDLLAAYAKFFNKYFNPHRPVEASHLATAPGASGSYDALLYNICDPGDGVLMPGPYWNGFDFGIRVRSSVNPVLVSLPSLNSNFTEDLIVTLEETIEKATCPIRALMITNPHNPLGLCYPKTMLEECLRFCKKHHIHFISDEVYALTNFENPDILHPAPFVSVLSLDPDQIGADSSRVHVVWSTSKDFGQSGFRMGCSITQSNKEMAVGVALATNSQISALSTIFVTCLLNSPQLPSLISLNSKRLAKAYKSLTKLFKEYCVPYVPCDAGLYVFAKLAPNAQSWEEEAMMVTKFKEAGVVVSSGRSYHGLESEKGWARVGFAVEPSQLEEAIRRMRGVMARESSPVDPKSESVYKQQRPLSQEEDERPLKRIKVSQEV